MCDLRVIDTIKNWMIYQRNFFKTTALGNDSRCTANLDAVSEAGATLVVGAPKIRGGTGGPARIFAMA